MEYVGYLLIVAAGAGLGLYAGHCLTRRSRYVAQTCRLLAALERQVDYSARPMGDLWRQLHASGLLAEVTLLGDTVAALGERDFTSAFTAAVERAYAARLLTEEGRQLLLEFGADCGRYDLQGQLHHIRHYRERLACLQEELDEKAAVRGRLYRVMGLAGGLALVLMLM